MSVYKKLAAIQGELIAPKGQHNDFGKYNYRSCEDILKAVKPLCEKNDCMIYITNELKIVGDRYYVEAKVTFVDLESDEKIVSTAQAREEESKKGMDGSQVTGASSSYARKYALAGLFCIDNEKDSDATNNGDGKEDKKTKPEINSKVADAERRARILKYINSKNEPEKAEAWICKRYGVEKSSKLSAEQQINLINELSKKGEAI